VFADRDKCAMSDGKPTSPTGSVSDKTLEADEKTLATDEKNNATLADEKNLEADEKPFEAATPAAEDEQTPAVATPAAGETNDGLHKTMSAKEAMAELNRVMTSGEGIEYPTGARLNLVSLALCLSVFLMALDNTIIATAIPHITDQFHSLPGESPLNWAVYSTVPAQSLTVAFSRCRMVWLCVPPHHRILPIAVR
jgi:hypothetical protein